MKRREKQSSQRVFIGKVLSRLFKVSTFLANKMNGHFQLKHADLLCTFQVMLLVWYFDEKYNISSTQGNIGFPLIIELLSTIE